MNTKLILYTMGICLAGIITLLEIGYYFSHPYRPGVSPHLIGLGLAVLLIGVAGFIKQEKER